MESSGEELKWQKVQGLEEQICIKIPKNWKRPTKEVVIKKFPYREKPQEIFISPEGKRILTYNLLERQLQGKQVYPAILGLQRMISRIYPESVVEQAKVLRTTAGSVGSCSFLTGGMNGDGYHYMFVLPVYERMMLGSYHFPAEWLSEERLLFLNIVRSIEIKEKDKCGHEKGRIYG